MSLVLRILLDSNLKPLPSSCGNTRVKCSSTRTMGMSSFLIYIYSPPMQDLPPPGFNLHVGGSDDFYKETEHQTNTKGRASLKSVVIRMLGPPYRQRRTEHKEHTSIHRIEIEIPDPPGIEPGPPDWKAGILAATPRRDTYNGYVLNTNLCTYLLLY